MRSALTILNGTMTSRRRRLQWLFGVVSLLTTLVLLVLGGVALRSTAVSHRTAIDAARPDLAALEAGRKVAAVAALVAATERGTRLRTLALQLIHTRRDEVMSRLQQAERVWGHTLVALALAVGLAIAGALGSGYLLARRVAR